MTTGADRTLRIAVNMVTKALLQYLMLLAPDPDFPELWSRILQVLTVSLSSLHQMAWTLLFLFGFPQHTPRCI